MEEKKPAERPPARSFEDLLVWRKAKDLAVAVYRLTRDYPRDERFGLTQQMRRAAVSVPANISEGFKRRTRPDKVRILNFAQGSLEKLRNYLIISKELGYLPDLRVMPALEEVSRMLDAYMSAIANNF